MKEQPQHSYSLPLQHSIQQQFQASQLPQPTHQKYLTLAYTLLQKENPPPLFKLDPFQKHPLKGTKLFDYFLSRLKEWNSKVSKNPTSNSANKKQVSLFTFIYSYLTNLQTKPGALQHTLLENLFNWYQQSINPKPKISDILKGLKKKTGKFQTEDDSVRKTFNSNLSLKYNICQHRINNFYRRQFGHTFTGEELGQGGWKRARGSQLSVEQGVRERIRRREEEKLRTWREEKELEREIGRAMEARTKREEMACRTTIGGFRGRGMGRQRSERGVRPGTQQGEVGRKEREKERGRTPNIRGLMLMTNPYEMNKK